MRSSLEWEKDYKDCLTGRYGLWWRLRAERARQNHENYWRKWQFIRSFEEPPEEGYLRLINDD